MPNREAREKPPPLPLLPVDLAERCSAVVRALHAHRSSILTSRRQPSMWLPHPAQEGRRQLEHSTWKHMVVQKCGEVQEEVVETCVAFSCGGNCAEIGPRSCPAASAGCWALCSQNRNFQLLKQKIPQYDGAKSPPNTTQCASELSRGEQRQLSSTLRAIRVATASLTSRRELDPSCTHCSRVLWRTTGVSGVRCPQTLRSLLPCRTWDLGRPHNSDQHT